MKKFIAALLAVSTLFLLCSCSKSSSLSWEDRKLLKAVQQELMEGKFKAVVHNEDTDYDAIHIVTFSKDTITYEITETDANGVEFTHTSKVSYTMSKKYNAPYVVVDSGHFENLRVLLVDKNLRKDGEDIVTGLKGDTINMRYAYERIK